MPNQFTPNQPVMVPGPGGQMLPVAPNAVSPDFLQQIMPEQTFTPAMSQDQARANLDELKRQEEKERAIARQADILRWQGADPIRAERIALRKADRRADLEAAPEIQAERLDRRLAEFQALQADRAARGLSPQEMPADLAAHSARRAEAKGEPRVSDPTQFVDRPGQERGFRPGDLLGQEQLGAQMRIKGVTDAAGAQQKFFEEQADLLRRADDRARAMQESHEETRRAHQARLNDIQTQYQEALDEMKDFEFDPTGGWKDKGNFNKALAGVSIFLGGIGAAYLGQPNQAYQILNDSINRDIDAQRAEFEKLGAAATGKLNTFAKMSEIFDREEHAMEASRIAMMDSFARKLEVISAKSGSQQAIAQATDLIGQITQDSAQRQMQLLGALQGAQPKVSDKTRDQLIQLETADKTINEIETLYQSLGALAGPAGRIPATDAAAAKRIIRPRMSTIVQAIYKDDKGRGEAIVRDIIKSMDIGLWTFQGTVQRLMSEVRRDLNNKRQSIINVQQMLGGGGLDALQDPEQFEEFDR